VCICERGEAVVGILQLRCAPKEKIEQFVLLCDEIFLFVSEDGDVKDLVESLKNYKDKSSSSESLLVFGVGDGGGGPQSSMIVS
jgi:serine/threonine protein phosphatase PrpC